MGPNIYSRYLEDLGLRRLPKKASYKEQKTTNGIISYSFPTVSQKIPCYIPTDFDPAVETYQFPYLPTTHHDLRKLENQDAETWRSKLAFLKPPTGAVTRRLGGNQWLGGFFGKFGDGI